jgi:putative endonuclease
MKGYNKKLGQWGEELASRFLINKGFEKIDSNWQKREGEIDLIFKKNDEIIFVEVKTRTNCKFGYPEESINFAKRQKLTKIINRYLKENNVELFPRFDLVVVEFKGLQPHFTHFESLEL